MPRMFGVYVLERVFDVAATAVIAGLRCCSSSSVDSVTAADAH